MATLQCWAAARALASLSVWCWGLARHCAAQLAGRRREARRAPSQVHTFRHCRCARALHIRCHTTNRMPCTFVAPCVEAKGQVMVLSRQALHMLRQGSSQQSHSSCSSSASLVSCSIVGHDCQPMSCQCISGTVTDKRLAQAGCQVLPLFARLSRPTLGWCGRLTAHPAAAG